MSKVENIANLGVKPVVGECSYEVFYLPNGAWEKAQYQVGTVFDVEFAMSERGMVVTDPDGDRIWVSAGEQQCFKDVE